MPPAGGVEIAWELLASQLVELRGIDITRSTPISILSSLSAPPRDAQQPPARAVQQDTGAVGLGTLSKARSPQRSTSQAPSSLGRVCPVPMCAAFAARSRAARCSGTPTRSGGWAPRRTGGAAGPAATWCGAVPCGAAPPGRRPVGAALPRSDGAVVRGHVEVAAVESVDEPQRRAHRSSASSPEMARALFTSAPPATSALNVAARAWRSSG